MKTFATLALTLILTAASFVGCGCTNQNQNDMSTPTVLPTNEEIWNSTESTTRSTTEATTSTDITNAPNQSTDTTDATGTTEATGSSNSRIQNQVNKSSEITDMLLEKDKANKETKSSGESSTSRMMPGTR